jgi:outer membrane protein assembly factor BamB
VVDIEALSAVLSDPRIGGYAVTAHCDIPESEARREIGNFFSKASRDDLLLLYISGHGIKDEDGLLHFAMTDSEPDDASATALSAAYVSDRMRKSPAKTIVLWLDCCFSGAFPAGMRHRAGNGVDVAEQLNRPGRGYAVMTASSALEYAFEGGRPAVLRTARAGPSVFTGVLTDALRTGDADRNGDGQVDIDELYDFVCSRVREITLGQTPKKIVEVEGTVYIARSPRGARPDAVLPPGITLAARSPLDQVRAAVIGDLAVLAVSPEPAVSAAARQVLEELAAAGAAHSAARTRARAALDQLRTATPPPATPPPAWPAPARPEPARLRPQMPPGTASPGARPAPRTVAPVSPARWGRIAGAVVLAAAGLIAAILIVPSLEHPGGGNTGGGASTGDSSTGDSSTGGFTATTALRWSFTPPGSFITNPAVAGKTAYVGSSDGKVYALNGTTGSQLWSSSLAGSPGGGGLSRPAVADGAVYIASENGKVYALNAATGGQLWSYSTGGTGFSNPVVIDGTVYIGSNDGKVYALNAATGSVRWASPLEAKSASSYGFSGPAVANGSVYVGGDNDKVYALNAATGSVRWTRLTGGAVNSYPTVAGDTVYVGSEDAKLYALNAATGRVRWTRLTGNYVDSSPAVAGATVYVGSDDDRVYALNAATGSVRWTRLTAGSVVSGLAVTDGTVYVGSDDGNWYALNAATGSVRWAYLTDAYASTNPVVANGIVYVSGPEQKLYALEAAK